MAVAETLYADLTDDGGIVAAIDSGALPDFEGKEIAWWQQRYKAQRDPLIGLLARLPASGLSTVDARAVRLMREGLDSRLPEDPRHAAYNPSPPKGRCADAGRRDLDEGSLSDSLYACFESAGNNLQFEGKRISRDSAIALLGQIDEPERRKSLFLAFTPLWQAINGRDEPDSPYRRRIALAIRDVARHGSPIDAAARDLGLQPDEVEHWLVRILETWRDVTPATPVEPWDYRYVAGGADRLLASAVTPASLLPITQRYYHDLGVDLERIGVLFDLAPRPGKAPVTYANYITMGRQVGQDWRPTRTRISANFSDSGLYVLNMLVHESAHAVHFVALHNRPAFMDLGSALFCEAFADVTSWDVYVPQWQTKYLGRSAPRESGLRSLYTMVTLESAWALFELRMLRAPGADPNATWTDITSRYLHIIAHPEYSWWAQRVQLVTDPGYLTNYGLGAAVTADIRHRIQSTLGGTAAGNAQWYAWVSRNLLRSGLQFETADLLRQFLGRGVSLDPLLQDMRRVRTE